ncbi:hypothetical protein [Kribbella swartbergensis]
MTPEEVFLKLVHGVADRDFDALPELYAEQTDVRHPMNPYGDRPLPSRDDHYIDHVAMTRARGGVENLIEALREPAGAAAAS